MRGSESYVFVKQSRMGFAEFLVYIYVGHIGEGGGLKVGLMVVDNYSIIVVSKLICYLMPCCLHLGGGC